MRLEGLGTEFGIAGLILWVILAVDRWLYPIWRRKWGNRRNNKRVADTMYSSGLTLDGVAKALEQHEKYDGERIQEMNKAIRGLRRDLQKYGERLAGLESRLEPPR